MRNVQHLHEDNFRTLLTDAKINLNKWAYQDVIVPKTLELS